MFAYQGVLSPKLRGMSEKVKGLKIPQTDARFPQAPPGTSSPGVDTDRFRH